MNEETKKSGFSGWWEKTTGKPLKTIHKVILLILLIVFLYVFYVTLDANKYQATVHVISGEGRVGLNPTAERLDFGDLSPGTSAVRRVELKNGTSIPVFVILVETGSIKDLMDLNKNFFRLNGGEETKIEFSTYMPASAEIDATYNGRVYLFKIPIFF